MEPNPPHRQSMVSLIKTEEIACQEQTKRQEQAQSVSLRHYRPPSDDPLAWCCSLPRALRNPSSSPRTPFGFGTGHSWPICDSFSASSSIWKNVDTSSSPAPEGAAWPGRGASVSDSMSFRRRRRIRGTCCPSAVIIISESARVRRGAGQGKMCGMPTTSSEASRVPANKPVVDRDRGCRCGGIVKKCIKLDAN